ncbi:MAG TPA: hypothetical protein VKF17_11895 [Isosphaeraceae bacterium]|nr:hypothetical protein [Isosphaeraceae bacterium]
MARHSIRVVFDPERGDFTRVSIEPGAPMLDPGQANYCVLARWLGSETVAEPILSPDERSVSFHVTREGKRQLEIRALPMTAEELDGEYAPALAEIERKLQEATWNNDGERALLKRALENWNFLKSPEGRDARLAHWFKYEAGQGQWRPLWCWGYMLRHEAIPFPVMLCANPSCATLFVHRQAATGGKPRCPHCRGPVADPKPLPMGATNGLTGGTGVLRSRLLAGGVAGAALLMLGLLWWLNRPDDKETKPAPPAPNPGKLARNQPQTPHRPSRDNAGSEGQGSKGNPNERCVDQPPGGPDDKSHGDDFSSPAVAHKPQRSGDGPAPSSESSSEGGLPVATTSGNEKPTAPTQKEQDDRTAASDASGGEESAASSRETQRKRAASDASGDEKSAASLESARNQGVRKSGGDEENRPIEDTGGREGPVQVSLSPEQPRRRGDGAIEVRILVQGDFPSGRVRYRLLDPLAHTTTPEPNWTTAKRSGEGGRQASAELVSPPLRPTEDNQAYNLNLQVETPDGKTVQRPLRLNVESNVKVKLDAPKTP